MTEESPYISRQTRQYITRSAWIDDAADWLIDNGIYKVEEFNKAVEVCKRLADINADDAGELVGIDVDVFMKWWIRETLEQ